MVFLLTCPSRKAEFQQTALNSALAGYPGSRWPLNAPYKSTSKLIKQMAWDAKLSLPPHQTRFEHICRQSALKYWAIPEVEERLWPLENILKLKTIWLYWSLYHFFAIEFVLLLLVGPGRWNEPWPWLEGRIIMGPTFQAWYVSGWAVEHSLISKFSQFVSSLLRLGKQTMVVGMELKNRMPHCEVVWLI